VTGEPRPGAGESQALLARLERDTVLAGLVIAAVAFAAWPAQPRRSLGVLAGVLLVAVAYAGLRAGVDALMPPARAGGADSAASPPGPDDDVPGLRGSAPARPAASPGFVKFFTRHAILAAGAYVMIARFELHPVAMLAGVTTPAVAAGIEFVRIVRARGTGSHSRSS
jgi:hypothetical protein